LSPAALPVAEQSSRAGAVTRLGVTQPFAGVRDDDCFFVPASPSRRLSWRQLVPRQAAARAHGSDDRFRLTESVGRRSGHSGQSGPRFSFPRSRVARGNLTPGLPQIPA